jgi:hypothetical protein
MLTWMSALFSLRGNIHKLHHRFQISDSVEEDSGESVKIEDREQFNSFQENCDEVVQMESENQELVVESFPFEQSDLRDDNSKYLHRYLQVSTQMAMDNNPSSKRAGVVFFALRLSYRLSDLIVRMGSFLQLIPDFHFPFEQHIVWSAETRENPKLFMLTACEKGIRKY